MAGAWGSGAGLCGLGTAPGLQNVLERAEALLLQALPHFGSLSEHRDKPGAPKDLRVLSIHGDHRNITEEQALEMS